jgi:GNAT superfamily N-acetyltransferase
MALCWLVHGEATMRMELLHGKEIDAHVKQITDLALIIYREYPYLYEGTEEEYLPLIQHYAQSERGLAYLLYDDEKPVGVAIGTALQSMRESYKEPILNSHLKDEIDSLFYLGEFLLLKEYRGKGFGKQMYNDFEKTVKTNKSYTGICFCKIVEFDQHPGMPANYKPLDGFWSTLGFHKLPNIQFSVSWRNVNEQNESPHQLVYWIKFF